MAVEKSEKYSSLLLSCDELRGGMDASQYKDYVLVPLFIKYDSDKYGGDPNALIEVPKGGSFAGMVPLKGEKEIGDKINKIIARLAAANDLKGVIDVANFNDPETWRWSIASATSWRSSTGRSLISARTAPTEMTSWRCL
jgi:type I restriction enzyme M protein